MITKQVWSLLRYTIYILYQLLLYYGPFLEKICKAHFELQHFKGYVHFNEAELNSAEVFDARI